MKTIVSGSIAYDRIMEFPLQFSEYILPEKIDNLNVCFTVNGMKERFGGTAGNIAYALRLMGEAPEVSAAIGQDHANYMEWLRQNKISTGMIKIIDKDFTAGAFITTDKTGNQITVFNIGAMGNSSCLDFNSLDPKNTLLIISPGNLDDMVNYPRQCKEKGIRYIFDPGQQLPVIPPEDLKKSIDGCMILICNEYEHDMIMSITGFDKGALLKMAKTIIVTRGEFGSVIFTSDSETEIPVVKANRVLDPTGAGDAYRGGLISGLVRGMDIRESAILGSVCASFAVECYGTQEYSFTMDEFQKRVAEISR
ncbi:MAG: carbohydrate kinase family protein [Deltaproteobacteria bacterium]|nr:carbohydrate kinase family protein [Deltaproteobacteria bacterium]